MWLLYRTILTRRFYLFLLVCNMWAMYGQCMGNVRVMYGLCMDNIWAICGQCVGNVWAMCGQYGQYMGNIGAMNGQCIQKFLTTAALLTPAFINLGPIRYANGVVLPSFQLGGESNLG